MRVLKLNWKCLAPVLLLGQRTVEALMSTQHHHSGEHCTIHLVFPAGSARRCLCICADKGEGHFGNQQRWQGGRSLRSWRAHLYERVIMTAEIVWAFLQAQSFLCCATLSFLLLACVFLGWPWLHIGAGVAAALVALCELSWLCFFPQTSSTILFISPLIVREIGLLLHERRLRMLAEWLLLPSGRTALWNWQLGHSSKPWETCLLHPPGLDWFKMTPQDLIELP